jgi:arylsulfatase A-like enzyme
MAEGLRDAGYDTGFFGKWHLGTKEPSLPEAQGFETVLDISAHDDRHSKGDGDPKSMRQITDAAIEFIEQPRKKPFFAFVSHHATHAPFESSPEWKERFRDRPRGHVHSNVAFAAMLAELDHHVGRLLDRIDELGLTDATLVVLTSDNGALPANPQTPLRGSKGMYYEGGIRVPLVVRWPGVTTSGSRTDVPTTNVDLVPTFLDAAGTGPPKGSVLDGESLAGLLRGDAPPAERALYWHFPGYLDTARAGSRDADFRTRPVSVIRRGPFKLHLYHEEWALDGGRAKAATSGAIELFDLTADPGEAHDLSGENEAVREALLDDLLEWIERVDAPMASEPNGTYVPRATPAS